MQQHGRTRAWARWMVERAREGSAPWLLLIVLDLLLFLPSYLFAQPSQHFLPYFPHARALGSRVCGYLLALFVRRDNLDIFRVSVELGLLTLCLVWTARGRLARITCAVAAALYSVLLLFLGYHHAMGYYFARPPALSEDIRLSMNLLQLIRAMKPLVWLEWALGIVALFAAHGLALFVFRELQLRAAQWPRRAALLLSVCMIVPAALSVRWFGVERDDPLFQVTSKRVVDNYRASRSESARMRELRHGAPDRRYDTFSKVALARKPDVYLLMVEAYGEILATWDMSEAYRALLSRVEHKLDAAGYATATTYSASPVHGGTSWFSIATVNTGIWIDRPLAYAELTRVGKTVPSMTRFFDDHGYHTLTLQPGTRDRRGEQRFDLYDHDVVVNADVLAYPGHEYGWGRIPDQYSLGVFRERYWSQTPGPRYVFYMAVSTHFPWGDDVPSYVNDWNSLRNPDTKPAPADARWPDFPQVSTIGTDLRRSYFRSIEYELRLLTEWLEAEAAHDSVILIVGDHQPRLEADAPGRRSMNTPVHVIARDPALIESFVQQGFEPGMYADPKHAPPLRHSALLSLLISKLAGRYGTDLDADVPYYPDGIRLSGLNR